MKCYGLTINLKDDPEVIAQYKAYHRDVWPEVLEQARNLGILKTRIFLIGLRLFMYIETEDGFDFGRAFSAPGGGAATAAGVGRPDARLPGTGAGGPGGRMVGPRWSLCIRPETRGRAQPQRIEQFRVAGHAAAWRAGLSINECP